MGSPIGDLTKEQVNKCMEIFFTQFFMPPGPEKKAYLDKIMPDLTEDEYACLQSLSDFAHFVSQNKKIDAMISGEGSGQPDTIRGVGPLPTYPPGTPFDYFTLKMVFDSAYDIMEKESE